jgi:hypothetical protein
MRSMVEGWPAGESESSGWNLLSLRQVTPPPPSVVPLPAASRRGGRKAAHPHIHVKGEPT